MVLLPVLHWSLIDPNIVAIHLDNAIIINNCSDHGLTSPSESNCVVAGNEVMASKVPEPQSEVW